MHRSYSRASIKAAVSASSSPKESRTQKPCHGCGEPGWREADKVCSDCAELLRLGRETRDAPAEGDLCQLPERDYAWRRYFASTGVRGLHDCPGGSELSESLARFVWACSREVIGPRHMGNAPAFFSDGQGGWLRRRVLPAGSLQHLVTLDREIQATLTEAARVAFQAGRNLLLSLNNGTISPDEFNKRDGGRE